MPVEKVDARATLGSRSPLELENICFLGTSVESGTATAAVVATGPQTYFGGMARSITGQEVDDQLRPGRQQVHLADDHADGGHVAARVPRSTA